jgi:hypothetical protein
MAQTSTSSSTSPSSMSSSNTQGKCWDSATNDVRDQSSQMGSNSATPWPTRLPASPGRC